MCFIIYSDLYLLIRILLARTVYIISFHLQQVSPIYNGQYHL